MTDAPEIIRRFATQPEIDNGEWGNGPEQHADARLLFDKEKFTRTIRNRRTGKEVTKTASRGGFKDWRWDMRQAGSHLLKAFRLKKNTSLDDMFRSNFRRHLFMAWFYLRNTNLNRPDGMVAGTTLYGVWIEEVWHASLWSPDVAKAVADLLEENPDSPKAKAVADLIQMQYTRLTGKNDNEEDSSND